MRGHLHLLPCQGDDGDGADEEMTSMLLRDKRELEQVNAKLLTELTQARY